MKKNAFTLLEILVVLFIIGTLTISGLKGFKHTRAAHQVESLMQELTLLRTAILAYKEVHGSLPTISESALSSNNFSAIKPFWYPFKPDASKIVEGSKWWGKIGTDAQTFLALKKGNSYFSFDMGIIEKKFGNLCCVNNTGTQFYILTPYSGCN